MTLLMPHAIGAVETDSAVRLQEAVVALKQSKTAPELHVDGHVVALPPAVIEALTNMIQRFAEGDGVLVGSMGAMVTTSQAAEMLGISRTYLIRLIDDGKLPVEYRGTHRRVQVKDVLAYIETSRRARSEKLDAITRLSARAGLYDDDDF